MAKYHNGEPFRIVEYPSIEIQPTVEYPAPWGKAIAEWHGYTLTNTEKIKVIKTDTGHISLRDIANVHVSNSQGDFCLVYYPCGYTDTIRFNTLLECVERFSDYAS